MKKLLTFTVLTALFSFTKSPAPFSAKGIEKSFGKIKEHIYVSKYEVSNSDYKTFLAALAADNKTAEYTAALPDTLVWREASSYNEPFTAFYFNHPAFAQYPVVGVSYENALAYCTWMTEVYNSDEHRKFSKVMFRLPAKTEWELAANGGNENKQYPWGTGFIHNSRSMALCNYREDPKLVYDSATKKYIKAPDSPGGSHTGTKLTSPVKSFYPSSFGMYNMSGNVAEMISEKGIAKGGSYDDPAWEVTIASEKNYTKPTADIGFRVVMEVLED